MKRKKEDQDSSAAEALTEDDRLKKKKVRTTFTGRQIFELEKMFETKKYLSSSERTELAKMLNVTEQQVSSVLLKILKVSQPRWAKPVSLIQAGGIKLGS